MNFQLLQNLECNNFKIDFKVWKRQLYKSVAMPTTLGGANDRGNVFRIGIGDNCDGMLTKEVQADGKKHGYRHGQSFLGVHPRFYLQHSIISKMSKIRFQTF